jgi:hypothetical protein
MFNSVCSSGPTAALDVLAILFLASLPSQFTGFLSTLFPRVHLLIRLKLQHEEMLLSLPDLSQLCCAEAILILISISYYAVFSLLYRNVAGTFEKKKGKVDGTK